MKADQFQFNLTCFESHAGQNLLVLQMCFHTEEHIWVLQCLLSDKLGHARFECRPGLVHRTKFRHNSSPLLFSNR